jgi:preprotein translocase subunit SecF
MKNNRKISKKAISLFAVIILIVLLFFFLQKFNNKTDANGKNKGTINTEELDKNSGKTSTKNPETVLDKSGENQTSVTNEDTKKQEDDNTAKGINDEKGITVFVKDATFGSTAEILIDSSNFNSSYKYYQIFIGKKPISNIESITKVETTMFPAQEAGSEVVLNLLDENKKVLKKLNVKLNVKK